LLVITNFIKFFPSFISDYITAEASKILRLLHIRDLRELQNRVNEAIVAVQSITANPKTDTKLGKVGRG
jgi:RLL motif-containing protein 1